MSDSLLKLLVYVTTSSSKIPKQWTPLLCICLETNLDRRSCLHFIFSVLCRCRPWLHRASWSTCGDCDRPLVMYSIVWVLWSRDSAAFKLLLLAYWG